MSDIDYLVVGHKEKSAICNRCEHDYTGNQLEIMCMDENNNCQMCHAALSGKYADGQTEQKHSHYHKDVSQYDTIDIYVICDLYVNDNSGCIQHAVKKLLCCGNRGVKDNVKDLQEAIDTIQRKIEILQGKGE